MAQAVPPQPPRRSLFTSLTFKVGFIGIFIMMFVMAAFSAVFIYSGRQESIKNIEQNGNTFADFSALPIYGYYTQLYTHPDESDFRKFATQVKNILDENQDIQRISLLAPNGRILFDSSELKDGKYKGSPRSIDDQDTIAALQSDEHSHRSLSSDGRRYTEIIVPLQEAGGSHIFSMRYELTYASLPQRMSGIYQRVAISVLALIVIVGAVALLLSQRLARPIIRITRVAEQIRGGNLSARVVIDRQDEIGRLGLALNEMAAQLQTYYRSLEQKVRQRTLELEAARAKLQQNVKQDEALLASIGDGVIATDRSGNIIWMNEFAVKMLKITEPPVGKHFDTVVSIEDEKGEPIPVDRQPTRSALETRTTVRTSAYYYAHKDASGKTVANFPVAATVAPVVLGNDTVGLINVFRDITKEKQVDRMKTEFISLASHQLRTPLSAIKWFSEMLLSGDAGELTPDQVDFAKNISESTERMIALVNALLNISRIESGRIMVDPKPTDLRELVAGIVNDLKAKTEERKQNLIISVHADLPKINVDPRLIGQVYLNLLTNAIKYTPKGGEISVFISRRGNEVISQVTDNGYGIPKEQQGRIFQRFFRAANAVKVETDGTGLGLYLIKAIIESSGGKIWFESEENKGTTFWFSIPLSGMKRKEGEVTLDM